MRRVSGKTLPDFAQERIFGPLGMTNSRLVDEYDLTQRGLAISRKLDVIRGTADTLTDLFATRTSHRLEWYIIALIGIEIGLSLYDRFWK